MCNNCPPEEYVQQSCSPIDASCVIYNKDLPFSDLNCIENIEAGTDLKTILETWDKYFCELINVPVLSCIRDKFNLPADTQFLPQTDLLQSIQTYLCNLQDVRVKASQADTSSGYLVDKIAVGECLDKTIIGDANKQVKIEINWGCVAAKIPTCFNIEANNCITVEAGSGDCAPQPLTPIITRNSLTLTGTNCNGGLLWYDGNNELVGAGTNFTAQSSKSYYAICTTVCGQSPKSIVIDVPVITTYTKIRTAVFTRNNCGNNTCNVPCTGSSETFSKTYTSNISQENANSIAENDMTFSIDGQNYVNTVGTCTCADCNCQFPTYNSNIVITNASCNNKVIQATGQILIAGLTNATRFGYSFGTTYSGVGFESAFKLGTNQGNVETTLNSIRLKSLSTETKVYFRLYNNSGTCFKDVIVTMSPPDCTKEVLTIGGLSVSCEVEIPECLNYTIAVGGSGSIVWYTDCSTNKYVYESLLANQSIQKCSKSVPIATGAVVTENGACI